MIGAIGAGTSSLDYALAERCQSPQGWMAAIVIGGLTGGKGKAAGKVVDEGVDIFRAVKQVELDDLEKLGCLESYQAVYFH